MRSAISYKWRATRRSTTVTRLIVRDVPELGWVELRCSGKGKGCPTTRTVTRKRIATTSFKTLFGKRKLKPGAQVEIRVLAPGMVAKVARFQIRAGKLPKVTFLCLAPGASRPRSARDLGLARSTSGRARLDRRALPRSGPARCAAGHVSRHLGGRARRGPSTP